MTFQLGFFNDSDHKQDWALFLDGKSYATFSLEPHKGTAKYVNVDFKNDGDKLQISVDTTDLTAAAELKRSGDKLVLTSATPKEWVLDAETKSQYLITCKLA